MKKNGLLNASIVGLFIGVLISRLFLFAIGSLNAKNDFFEYIVIHPSLFTTVSCLLLIIISVLSNKILHKIKYFA